MMICSLIVLVLWELLLVYKMVKQLPFVTGIFSQNKKQLEITCVCYH